MLDVIGIDSRRFFRENHKRNKGFESTVGIAVRVRDYLNFFEEYKKVLTEIFNELSIKKEYDIYCYNDIKDHPKCLEILDLFAKKIAKHIHKIHVFYSLFSSKKISVVKVYGRQSQREKKKFSSPTRTYKELNSEHLINIFPAICAWRLLEKLQKSSQFHIDSFAGHTCEAYEELAKSGHDIFVYTSGDCTNPVISTADLLIALLDKRLSNSSKRLLYQNLRPALPEFKDNLLAYPISNVHLPKITPLEKKQVNPENSLMRPVFWVFKGSGLMDSGVLKRSKTYRNFLDVVSFKGGCAKLFSKSDAEQIKKGDYGIYLDSIGEEIIDSYAKIGKRLIKYKIDLFVKVEEN